MLQYDTRSDAARGDPVLVHTTQAIVWRASDSARYSLLTGEEERHKQVNLSQDLIASYEQPVAGSNLQ